MTPYILVIDDDPAILMTVADILLDEGYSVRTVPSGLEGLAMIEAQRPALIILDMRMPGLDGWGVARALRDRAIVVPLIVMTAAQDMRWGHEIGAAHILEKPFDLTDLLTAVRRIVTS
jgi:DNA-binding response OmpR family regulator